MGRLTDEVGIVCRHCDAYNDPGARTCRDCAQALGAPTRAPAAGPAGPAPSVAANCATATTPPPVVARRCAGCGTVVKAGSFCAHCGAALSGAVPQSRPTGSFFRARLVVERGEVAPGTAVAIGGDEVQIGRAQGQLLVLDDPCLAPLHASFVVRDGTLVVRDEGAAGGVFVRLRGVTVPLKSGSLFAVGDRLLRFGGPLPPPPPPSEDGTRRLGAPRPDAPAVVLEEWLEGGLGGRTYVRSGASVTIGRAGCSVNLGPDPFLGQAHAEILVERDGAAKLRDLGSATGTYLRIAPGSERPLYDGDGVRLGREVLRVEVG